MIIIVIKLTSRQTNVNTLLFDKVKNVQYNRKTCESEVCFSYFFFLMNSPYDHL